MTQADSTQSAIAVTPAVINWSDRGEPYAPDYEDLYFSAIDGLAESRHVFLNGNALSERINALASTDTFTVCETGFGTGLNLYALIQCWQQRSNPKPSQRLHFLSFDRHPLNRSDLGKANENLMTRWPELSDVIQAFWPLYPPLSTGVHQFKLNDSITISLAWHSLSDVMTMFPAHHPLQIDAWFLDGFAPSRNESMWTESLFEWMNTHSRPAATVATFTAAGFVRRGLISSGFNMSKVKGFGHKREMLTGKRLRTADLTPASSSPAANWLNTENQPRRTSTDRQAVIVGAGIAGCTLSRHLADLNWKVTLLDQHDSVACGTSGNRQAMVYGRLASQAESVGDFVRHALLYSTRYYQKYLSDIAAGNLTQGYLQSVAGDKAGKLLEAYQSLPELVNEPRNDNRSFKGHDYPLGGWVHPESLCKNLIDHENIHFHGGVTIKSCHHTDNQWQIKSNKKTFQSGTVVFCTGHLSHDLNFLNWLPLRPIRGQVSHIKATDLSSKLEQAICSSKYLTPAVQLPGETAPMHTLGATLIKDNTDLAFSDAEQEENWQGLLSLSQQLDRALDFDRDHLTGGRVGIRAATPDYLPICGPILKADQFKQDFAGWRKDCHLNIEKTSPVYPGLFINTGFGSRGFAYAPLCAAYLAAALTGEIPPISVKLIKAIHPARFLIRELVKNEASH